MKEAIEALRAKLKTARDVANLLGAFSDLRELTWRQGSCGSKVRTMLGQMDNKDLYRLYRAAQTVTEALRGFLSALPVNIGEEPKP